MGVGGMTGRVGDRRRGGEERREVRGGEREEGRGRRESGGGRERLDGNGRDGKGRWSLH